MKLLLRIFEEFLDQAPDSSAHDIIRQSVIILTGSLAKHLSKTDPKVCMNFFFIYELLFTEYSLLSWLIVYNEGSVTLMKYLLKSFS